MKNVRNCILSIVLSSSLILPNFNAISAKESAKPEQKHIIGKTTCSEQDLAPDANAESTGKEILKVAVPVVGILGIGSFVAYKMLNSKTSENESPQVSVISEEGKAFINSLEFALCEAADPRDLMIIFYYLTGNDKSFAQDCQTELRLLQTKLTNLTVQDFRHNENLYTQEILKLFTEHAAKKGIPLDKFPCKDVYSYLRKRNGNEKRERKKIHIRYLYTWDQELERQERNRKNKERNKKRKKTLRKNLEKYPHDEFITEFNKRFDNVTFPKQKYFFGDEYLQILSKFDYKKLVNLPPEKQSLAKKLYAELAWLFCIGNVIGVRSSYPSSITRLIFGLLDRSMYQYSQYVDFLIKRVKEILTDSRRYNKQDICKLVKILKTIFSESSDTSKNDAKLKSINDELTEIEQKYKDDPAMPVIVKSIRVGLLSKDDKTTTHENPILES